MYNLTVNWENSRLLAVSLAMEWLAEIGVRGVSHSTVTTILFERTLVIPHSSWVYHGFSGASLPPFIALDYHNKTSALKKTEDVKFYLHEYEERHRLAPLDQKVVHYDAEGKSLCGRPLPLIDFSFDQSAAKIKHLTNKLNKITCSHCFLEIMVRLPVSQKRH